MLQQIYIIVNDNILYQRNYAKGLDKSIFMNIYPKLRQDILSKHGKEIGDYDFFKSKISYTVEKDLDLIIIFVSGLTDEFDRIKIELHKLKKEFLNLFGDLLKSNFDSSIIEVMNPIMDSIHKNLKPKISIVGYSGVGKTTITKLIKAEEIPMKHIPTITGDVATIKMGNLYFFLWDFAGQEQFSFLWNKFIKESDAVLLITDSTLENIEKSKFFINLIKEEAPYAQAAIIANKQDLSSPLSVEIIEDLMGIKTYSMVAIDPENKNKMVRIIADILEMNPEVSPLLKPLFERDRLITDAQNSIQQGNYQQAINLYEKITDICIELGDDSLGFEFREKTENLKNAIKSQISSSE